MQAASTTLVDLIKSSDTISAKARVIAEWNHNRYSPIAYKDNSAKPEATYGFDLEMYPFDSLVEAPRPTRGILKARGDQPFPIRSYSDGPAGTRVYTADVDSKYKYWMSPERTDNYYTDVAQTMLRMQNCIPTVIYASPVQSNKIYLCFETGWATPTQMSVEITTNGTTWNQVAFNPNIDSKGRVQLWRQENGDWTGTKNLDHPAPIHGIRVQVLSMNRMYARLSMIEMGLRLERDLSEYLITYNVDHSMSESDFITPLGTISSNVGNVTLSNTDGTFNHENTESLYYGLMDANVLFTIDLGIEASPGVWEYLREGTLHSTTWTGDYEVTVELKDDSKFLQEDFPNRMLMENCTIGKAIWRLLDSVGFTNYQYTRAAADAPSLISYYWTDGDLTIWDTIQELCRTTQTSAYFDEFGVFQIKTRSQAFDKTQSVKWTFEGDSQPGRQPDIIDLSPTTVYEANKVNIGYQKTTLLENNLGEPLLETVWEPGSTEKDETGKIVQTGSDTFVLRATGLRSTMTATQDYFVIAANQTASWPYEGMVNIHGELIRYHGKQYAWYDGAGGRHYDWLYSTEDKLRYDREISSPVYRGYNFFTGAFKIIERGYDYTEAQSHNVGLAGWRNAVFYGDHGGPQWGWNGGVIHVPHLSSLRIQTNNNFNSGQWCCAHRDMGQTMNYFGTRLRFPSNPKAVEQSAGIFFYGDDGNRANMYAVDVTSTARMEVGNRRLTGNEVRVFRRKNGTIGTFHCLGPDPTWNAKGMPMSIVDDQWVDIDVYARNNIIQVWVNGKLSFSFIDPAPLNPSNRMGLYVRGNTVADFEYFYALKDGVRVESKHKGNQDFMDIVDGAYYSNQYYKDVLWDWRNVKKKRGKKTVTVKQKYANRVMDEFGDVVHEVREYDVVFTKAPVLKSMLDFSNTKQVVVDSYVHTPFGAKFRIANAARTTAILNGEDASSGRDQFFDVIGRTVQQQEEKTYTVQNDQAIRARGEIVVDIDSRWIQSEGAARDLGDWIINNWSDSNDEIELSSFANPMLQVGDLVAVNYEPKDMNAATHKYFVTSLSKSWNNGPVTDVGLRRARV